MRSVLETLGTRTFSSNHADADEWDFEIEPTLSKPVDRVFELTNLRTLLGDRVGIAC